MAKSKLSSIKKANKKNTRTRSSQKKISPYLRDQKNKELKIHGLQNEQEKRPSTQKEREEVIDSEDEELISEYGKGSNFLVNMKFDEKQGTKREREEDDDDGNDVQTKEEIESDDNLDEKIEKQMHKEKAPKRVKTEDKWNAKPATEEQYSKMTPQGKIRHLALQKDAIAHFASFIVESSEEEKTIFSKLLKLHSLCSDADPAVKKLAILSEMTVFKDILPGYVIKPLAEEQDGKTIRLKKDVYAKNKFEKELLQAYHRFLKFLSETIQACKPLLKIEPSDMRAFEQLKNAKLLHYTCLKAQCFLLQHCFHFNFSENLVTAVVPLLNAKDETIKKMAYDTVVDIFNTDKKGEVTLEICRLIALVCKKKNFSVDPNFVRCFLHLHITEDVVVEPEEMARDKKKQKKFVSKRKKKQEKLDKIVEREMQEAEAEYSKEQLKKTQTQILDIVFTTFFRVLTTAPDSPLLPTVLDGIALFSHLISVDFMTEIIKSIETFAHTGASEKNSDDQKVARRNVSVAVAFKSSLVVFQAMKTMGYCIDVDVKDFYSLVYRFLMSCNEVELTSRKEETLIDENFVPDADTPLESTPRARVIQVALRTIELMLLEQRSLSVVRVAAFVKRLLTVSLAFRPWEVHAVLQIVTAIVARYPKVAQMLSSEVSMGSGQYRPDADEPDYANPFATSLWEVALLHRSYHPRLRKSVGAFLSSGLGKGVSTITFQYSPSLVALTSSNEWRGFSARAPVHRVKKNPRETPMDLKSVQRRAAGFYRPTLEDLRKDDPNFGTKDADEKFQKEQSAEMVDKLQRLERKMRQVMVAFKQSKKRN